MTDQPRFLAIITGSVGAALIDLDRHIKSFSAVTMRGELDDGPFMLVQVDHPHRLRGISLRGYEVHRSAYRARRVHLASAEALAKSRVRP